MNKNILTQNLRGKRLNTKKVFRWIMVNFDNLMYSYIIAMLTYFGLIKKSFMPITLFEWFLWIIWIIAITIIITIVSIRDGANKKEKEQITKSLPTIFFLISTFILLTIISTILILIGYNLIFTLSGMKELAIPYVSSIFTIFTYILIDTIFEINKKSNEFANKYFKSPHNAKKKS